MDQTLDIVEIFFSIQGESTRAGWPCAFVRLAGCNLRCQWCDTQYAWKPSGTATIDQILHRVAEMPTRRVEVTGGEPLTQPAALELLRRFCDDGYEVLLETNGSLDISDVDTRVRRIVDIKCPSSGQADRIHWPNLDMLGERDEVKFVVADHGDFLFARRIVREHQLTDTCEVTFSPVAPTALPHELADWILASGLDVRLGLQLHKVIWPGVERGV
ncbi:MAG: radical SAM protein [Phycisphaerae bacterium]